MNKFKNYIDGEWQSPKTGDYNTNVNPGNLKEELGEFPASGEEDVEEAVRASKVALDEWGRLPGPDRGEILRQFARLLEEKADELGEILTKEQGKALGEAVGEINRAASEAYYMAEEARRLWGETLPSESSDTSVKWVREPLGVVAAITPWNFPVVTPVRKIAPALACGDTVVFNPATYTPWTAVRLVQLFEEAGLPEGVLNLVMGSGSTVGSAISESEDVDGVTFTGSTSTGKKIYQSVARRYARAQLELGGKNPAVVFNAPDLEDAAEEIVSAAFTTSGQRCTALSRVIVSEAEAEKLTELIVNIVEDIEVVYGLEEMKDGFGMGPLVSEDQLEQVENYVEIARDGEDDAKILVGGERVDMEKEGYYYAPTVVSGVSRQSPLMQEEIFGPVLPIFATDSLEEAIEICNEPQYGLASSFFSRDIDSVETFAREVETGMVHINHGTASQAHVPFGGVKASGQGAYSIGSTAKDFFTVKKAIYNKVVKAEE